MEILNQLKQSSFANRLVELEVRASDVSIRAILLEVLRVHGYKLAQTAKALSLIITKNM